MKALLQIRTPFELKAVEESDGRRIVKGLASTWNLDLGNDVIHKGAFAKTLSHWKRAKAERPIHFIDQHQYGSVTRVVGKLIDASETDAGLETTFEMADHQHARDVFSLIKGGFITAMSIGYEAKKWETEKQDGKHDWEAIRHLTEVQLFEISAVIWGMNPEAVITEAAVKSLIEESKKRELTEIELRELKAFAVEIDCVLSKATPSAPPATTKEAETAPTPAKEEHATLEQVAAAQHEILLLKLRTSSSSVSASARHGESPNSQRTEENIHGRSTDDSKGKVQCPAA
jgi:HK97 family phage prohead protease